MYIKISKAEAIETKWAADAYYGLAPEKVYLWAQIFYAINVETPNVDNIQDVLISENDPIFYMSQEKEPSYYY